MSEDDHQEAIERVNHALRILDRILMQVRSKISSGNISDRAKVTAEVLPGAVNIAFGMRELLNKRLLLPTEILLRALVDRIGTLAYFRRNGTEALNVWKKGWSINDRPSFQGKLDMLPDEIFPHNDSEDPKKRFSTERLKSEIKALKKSMDSAVHGGPDSISSTFVRKDGNFDLHVIGPDHDNTYYFGNLSSLAVVSIMLFVFELESAFDTRGQEVVR